MKRLLHPVVVGLLLTAAVTGLAAVSRRTPLENAERHTLDYRFRLRGPRPVGPEVVIIGIDDKSDFADQTIVSRRSGQARIYRALQKAGAKVIGFDGFYFEPEVPIDAKLAAEILEYLAKCDEPCRALESTQLLARLRTELSGDEVLAAALREAGNVVLALYVDPDVEGVPEGVAKAKYGQAVLGAYPPPLARSLKASLRPFNDAAAALGFVSVKEDSTRTVRAYPAGNALGQRVFAPFGVQLVATYLGVGRAQLVFDGDSRLVRIGDRSFTYEPNGTFLLNYRGDEKAFPTYPVIDVLAGRIPEGALRNKIAIIGENRIGQDKTFTPFSAQMPGVMVNATFVDNLLRGDPLRRAPLGWDLAAGALLGLLVSLAFWPRLLPGAAWQIGASLAVAGAWLGGGYLAFARADLWVAWVTPGLTFLVAFLGCLAASYAKEGLQRRALRRNFSHVLAEEVIRDLEKSEEPLKLGGERRVLTALFSDIRGFTTLSERLDAMVLVKLLNTHLTAMTDEVLAQGGLLDKYIGDALMAFFGAPVPHADHVDRALAAVLGMHRELAALNAGPFEALGLTVNIGVGLNTGEMVVGFMGSTRRSNYTLAGDAVNLASRLEGLTKTYGVFCLCGDGTRRAAGPAFLFREVDLVQVKGKTEAVAIHELLAGPSGAIARYEDPEGFAQAVRAWREGRFAEARPLFQAFAAKNPADKVARLYLERLAALGEAAPAGWTGVFVHTSK